MTNSYRGNFSMVYCTITCRPSLIVPPVMWLAKAYLPATATVPPLSVCRTHCRPMSTRVNHTHTQDSWGLTESLRLLVPSRSYYESNDLASALGVMEEALERHPDLVSDDLINMAAELHTANRQHGKALQVRDMESAVTQPIGSLQVLSCCSPVPPRLRYTFHSAGPGAFLRRGSDQGRVQFGGRAWGHSGE